MWASPFKTTYIFGSSNIMTEKSQLRILPDVTQLSCGSILCCNSNMQRLSKGSLGYVKEFHGSTDSIKGQETFALIHIDPDSGGHRSVDISVFAIVTYNIFMIHHA